MRSESAATGKHDAALLEEALAEAGDGPGELIWSHRWWIARTRSESRRVIEGCSEADVDQSSIELGACVVAEESSSRSSAAEQSKEDTYALAAHRAALLGRALSAHESTRRTAARLVLSARDASLPSQWW